MLTELDRDGTDEAIAFYELTVNGVTSAWMSILVQKDGIWKSRQELPGEGAEIDFIDFAPVDRADHNNIIVGWIVAGQESMLCKVYDLSLIHISTAGILRGRSRVCFARIGTRNSGTTLAGFSLLTLWLDRKRVV